MDDFQLLTEVLDEERGTSWFELLSQDAPFESVARGRRGTVLLDVRGPHVPVVRSTTAYAGPHATFREPHRTLAAAVAERCGGGPRAAFNNALIELYDHRYRSMRAHTDQALDLAPDSFICLFSCYSRPDTTDIRALTVRHKVSGEERTLMLPHLSALVFTTATNLKHVHKIVAPSATHDEESAWLGLTLRVSSRAVTYSDGNAWLCPGVPLLLAAQGSEELTELFRMRKAENTSVECPYPAHYNITISPSDLLPPLAC